MASAAENVFRYDQGENVFRYDQGEITRDKHVDSIMGMILSGTSDEWKELIDNDVKLRRHLKKAVTKVVKYYETSAGQEVLPLEANQILAALNYCKPEDVKVIILGHDPICGDYNDQPLATGLAFSYRQGITENMITELGGPERSVVVVHTALRQAHIEPGESCCHEHWAERGVLLLNACLTIDPENDGEEENAHFEYWRSFICNLLLRLLQKIDKKRKDFIPVYVLCWGIHARDVGRYLRYELYFRGEWDDAHTGLLNPPPVIFIGHHPTYPTGAENKFIRQATNQFKAIMRCYSYSNLFHQEEEEERE